MDLAVRTGPQLLKLAERELLRQKVVPSASDPLPRCTNLELLTAIHSELLRRSRRKSLLRLEALCAGAQTPPIRWLAEAREVALRFTRRTRGKHYLYVIMKSGYQTGGGCGLYVGESSKTPIERYWQHKSGYKAGKGYHRFRGLLPSLYAHLNPLAEEEAEELEPRLATAFRQIRYEGHNVRVQQG